MEINQGADFDFTCHFTTRSGSGSGNVNLSGGVAVFMLKENVYDADDDALVHLISSASADHFSFTRSNSGIVVCTVTGDFTDGIDIDEKVRAYGQLEVSLSGHYYRSDNEEIVIVQSVL
jgi:hypothetical protein